MIPVKAYAALTPTSALVPFDFERRDLREHGKNNGQKTGDTFQKNTLSS